MKMTTLLTAAVAATLAISLTANAADAGRGARSGRGGDSVKPAARGPGDAPKARGAGDLAPKPARGDHPATTKPADPGANVDRREANQQHRIEAGIAHGQITPAEVALLKTQETSITTLEASLKSDGKLSKDEAAQLRSALNDASLQIWAQRHDTEGNQKPVSRLGKDIFANGELTAKIESGDLTKPQARMLLEDFKKLTTLKRRLGADNLTDAQRAEAQAQFNTLLNKYFIQK